ncbi:MAG: lysophospholipid acyltransferase family protein [Fimbriimonadaceae bacterium]|nr:lysophospholipid acyltransferase family protein [Fimbriimonadaceae bacterium]
MAKKNRVIINAASTVAFRFGLRAFQKGDIAQAERRAERLALVVYRMDRKHRERTISNLAMAFPEWDHEKQEATAQEVYRHFGRIAADFMRTGMRSPEEILSAEIIGIEHLNSAVAVDKGVLLITAHYGNWERFAHWYHLQGHTLSVVARDANQGPVTEQLTALRHKAGAEVMPRGNSARTILSKLRAKEFVGILNDQNCAECFVPFFGKPCGTVLGPAVLHLRTGAPILQAYFTRLGPGKYRGEFHEPIFLGDFDKDPTRITARLNEVLESVVRKHPEQWLWLHDRWKSARQRGML